jgi:hypothetical protein
MFFDSYRSRKESKNSTIRTLVNISSIVSAAITVISIAYKKYISIQMAAFIMVGVVIFVALGNNISKIVLTAIALFLFVTYYSYGDKTVFSQLMIQMVTLILVLIVLYVLIRGFFRR